MVVVEVVVMVVLRVRPPQCFWKVLRDMVYGHFREAEGEGEGKRERESERDREWCNLLWKRWGEEGERRDDDAFLCGICGNYLT